MIKKLLGLIFNRWVFLAIIFLAIALTVWYAGPLIAIGERKPLDSERSRLIAIGSIAFVMIALVALQVWRSRRTNAMVVNQLLVKPAGEEAAERESPDLAAVRQRFEQAMQTLRRARFGGAGMLAGWKARLGGRYVYELPWYLIIGAPGSGKTTALENCGLQFPLQSKVGQGVVRGVGGTRNCDWWFTDQAVLIDTAGRFTTQDSDAANDRATWGGFLQILKRSRPRQPINGVLLTVSIPDLLARTGDERRHYATTVRTRIQELHEDLGIRIPVYLLVTKCDLIAGFVDYFAILDKEQRAAAWGMTFPSDRPTQEHLKTFDAEFAALLKRLDDGLVEQLERERDPQRRARIYGFPNQFATTQGPLDEFLEVVFSPSSYEQDTLLRGVYFISGTQEGTPIDRVMATVARTFGLQRAMIAPNQAAGRSFFLTRLLGDVVFAERGLGGTNVQWERRRTLLAFGAYALLAVFTIGLLTAWTVSYFANRRYIGEVAARAEAIRGQTLSANRNVSIDARTVTPTLDAMRGLSESRNDSWKLGFGLSQARKLKAAELNAYERMLYALLLPNLEIRVEDRINREYDQPERQYESLRAYLMLHDAAHFDQAELKRYFQDDADTRYGRSVDQTDRASLENHLDNLLAKGASPTLRPPDQRLIDGVRQRIVQRSFPERVLNRLRAQGLGSDYPDFTVKGAGGIVTQLVFSNDALNAKVPGLYSYDGYHKGFQPRVAVVVKQLNEEQAWVLGIADPKTVNVTMLDNVALESQVRRLYLNEYTRVWKDFIAQVRLKTLTNATDAIQAAQQLSSADTPLRPLFKKISRETTLSTSTGGVAALNNVTKSIVETTNAIAGKIGAPKTDVASEMEKSLVDDQFQGIRAMVTSAPDGKAPIDAVIALIAAKQGELLAAQRAVQSGSAPPPPTTTLAVEASQQPEPIRTLLVNLSDQGSRQNSALLRTNLSNEVRSQLGEFCQRAFEGRYPFARNATNEVQQQDFATVFAPGGKFDQLMVKLAPYVDDSTWRFRPTPDGGSLGESSALIQLKRAKAIRDTFFPGTAVPTIRVTFKPLEMDSYFTLFSLDVDGQPIRYEHGPQYATTVSWPGLQKTNQVRINVTPAPPPGTPGLVFEGPWALLRMVDGVKMEQTGTPDRFLATFNIAQHWVKFEVSAASVRNPLSMSELHDFHCPMGL